jgi:hypothetical protein
MNIYPDYVNANWDAENIPSTPAACVEREGVTTSLHTHQ